MSDTTQKQTVTERYQKKLEANQKKKDKLLEDMHDALLNLGQHSVKDLTTSLFQCQHEERFIKLCLEALSKEGSEAHQT